MNIHPLHWVCPTCRSGLAAKAGGFRCRACGAHYPVIGDILRMLPPIVRTEQQTREAFDFEHRRYQAAQYLRISPALVEDWLAEVRLPRDHFQGLTALDVGCGSGRWTYALAMLGAKVVAVDFSDAAVEVTRKVTKGIGEVQVIQASLFHLPFEAEQFDLVVCWGVLHHTPNTERAFRTIAPLVKPGGLLHVMVYERRNPLKVLGTELLRMAMRKLPPETRYRICGRLVIRNRLLFHLLRGVIACIPVEHLNHNLDAETAQFGLYDWYSPRYNHLHRIEDVQRWFEQAGFDHLTLTSPIKYRQWLDVLRFGECGGSIHCRGTKKGRERALESEGKGTQVLAR